MTDPLPPEVVAGREAAVSVNAAAGIGRITLDRPELLNAVNVELGVELERAILVLGSDPTIHVPVVAAVEGVAAAGGFELMQAADVVLVSDDARISDNHIRFGMIPGGGSTQRLPRLIGRQRAMGVLLSGDRLSGADAVRLGLAYRSFPRDRFDDEIELFVSAMAGRDRGALTAIKHLVTSGLGLPVAAGLDDEITAVVRHISEGAGRNGASAFSERGGTR